jgi:hypothetical protein
MNLVGSPTADRYAGWTLAVPICIINTLVNKALTYEQSLRCTWSAYPIHFKQTQLRYDVD